MRPRASPSISRREPLTAMPPWATTPSPASMRSRRRPSTIHCWGARTTKPSPASAATTTSTAATASTPSLTTTSISRPAELPCISRTASSPATPRWEPTRCARSKRSREQASPIHSMRPGMARLAPRMSATMETTISSKDWAATIPSPATVIPASSTAARPAQ